MGVLQVPLQYVYESVQSVLPRMERLPAHPLKFHSPTHIAEVLAKLSDDGATQVGFALRPGQVQDK